MAESPWLEADKRPDFYIAAIGRSGSTLLGNWLTRPPDQLVFNEPFFSRLENSRLLRIQLAAFGMAADDDEWERRDESANARFTRLMATRLEGRRWAFKEVLSKEHRRSLELFAPPKIIITVRNIVDVALSFFEKHRAQQNLERFGDDWVTGYCADESTGILNFKRRLEAEAVPLKVVRYEDFVRSEQERRSVEEFVGWEGGGDTASNFNDFDRGFEIARHGTEISDRVRQVDERALGARELGLATALGDRCREYQLHFGYDAAVL
jgi:hypothetical protein